MSLTKLVVERLNEEGLKLDRFQEVVSYLMARGIALRDADGPEQRMYDDARRMESVLTEYFAIGGFRLVHDIKNEFFRLYAPGVQIPGYAEDGLEPVSALRAPLTPEFVAAALALRFLFQHGLTGGSGKLTDKGEVLIGFEELSATMLTQLKRPLPETLKDRTILLKDLKRHRLIYFASNFDLADEDALIAIRPTILGIVSEDTLASAIDKDPDATPLAIPQDELDDDTVALEDDEE
jgi:hypothetical protein